MSFANAAQYALFIAVVTALVRPIGGYLERVFSGAPTAVDRIMTPLERFIYRLTRVDPRAEMTAAEYSLSFVLFGLAGTLLLYGILRLQRFLPWFFPGFHTTPLSPDLSFNTAVSFSTTTTWQAYVSSFANNGQTFAGLSANSPFYNLTTAAVMLAGRFGLAVPALALAGLVARQGRRQ